MGREWSYKAIGVKRKTAKDKVKKNRSSWSCMSAIFNQFRFHHPSLLSQSTISIGDENSKFCVQGIEAPRNSLESAINVVSSSSELQVKEHIIKLNMLQIKTFTNDLSSENYCISPGTKTPNLVARLMGLPEYSSSTSHHHTRSLPSTPRLSTDYHHRLSLQENNSQQHEPSHIKTARRQSVRTSRRLGTDLTNTISTARRDSNLDLVKSPKLRLLDIKNNLKKPVNLSSIKEVKSKSHSHSPSRQRPAAMKPENVVKNEMIKSIECERYDLRVKKKMKQEVSVSVRKNKSTALPKHVFNKSSSSRLSQKQVSLPSNYLNSSYTTKDTHNLKAASTTKLRQPTVTGRRRMIVNNKFEAEVEDIVVEIESEIMGKLVHEIIAVAPAKVWQGEVTCAVHVIR